MWNMIRGLAVMMVVGALAGCGQEEVKPAASTPQLTPEQQSSIQKATEGGGGPAMIEKMKKEGKTKVE
jgi:predicted small lipoprotein YifL